MDKLAATHAAIAQVGTSGCGRVKGPNISPPPLLDGLSIVPLHP